MTKSRNAADRKALHPERTGTMPAQRAQPRRATPEPDAQKLLVELQVHQIELSMQNDELRKTQAELELSRALYFELYDLAPVGYCSLSEDGKILQANLVAATLLGVARRDLVGQAIHRFIGTECHDTFLRHCSEVADAGALHTCDLRMVKRDGSEFWACLRSVSTREVNGHHAIHMSFADTTEKKQMEEALREQKDFFHQIAENLSDFIAVLDVHGRRLYNSPSYQAFFGTLDDLQNSDSFVDVHADDRERVKRVFNETVRSGVGHHIEYRFQMRDGSVRDMESRGSVLRDKKGRATRVLVVSRDITEQRKLQEQVRHMAFHDVLTELPNRRLFADRLNQTMAANTRSLGHGALMFLDLDNFKALNDDFGHAVGDQLLIEAAARLKSCVRDTDTVARFGGDEFVVMLSKLEATEADATAHAVVIAEKLRAVLFEPYHLTISDEKHAKTTVDHQCPASIGMTLFGGDDMNPSDILKRADAVMYQAKQAGGNQVRVFDRLAAA